MESASPGRCLFSSLQQDDSDDEEGFETHDTIQGASSSVDFAAADSPALSTQPTSAACVATTEPTATAHAVSGTLSVSAPSGAIMPHVSAPPSSLPTSFAVSTDPTDTVGISVSSASSSHPEITSESIRKKLELIRQGLQLPPPDVAIQAPHESTAAKAMTLAVKKSWGERESFLGARKHSRSDKAAKGGIRDPGCLSPVTGLVPSPRIRGARWNNYVKSRGAYGRTLPLAPQKACRLTKSG
ncbi:heterogeneous nuclear ribonucleoprotein K [Striga asiatica]|uniref:Heterogeneous nuclear ribonucleoprotein K n=1 Tax=Striga asiatica TaxID=4170 RepID=A0A5A7QKF2_STRAF|nr:heterogeneous nuclear ribonucleoprotein K [Striga asiatica]